MSTNPDDYTLDNFILNIEGWGIGNSVQSRIGLSFHDLHIFTTPNAFPPGDLNGDGHVDIFDYNLLVSKFGNPYTIFDYNNLVANFGK